MFPRENLIHFSIPISIESFVEAAVTDCFQPSAVGEVLRPAIKFGASLPCEIKSLAQATVAAGENAFYDTGY